MPTEHTEYTESIQGFRVNRVFRGQDSSVWTSAFSALSCKMPGGYRRIAAKCAFTAARIAAPAAGVLVWPAVMSLKISFFAGSAL